MKAGDNINTNEASWAFSGEMVNDFEIHVKKSVPIYERGHELINELSDFFIKDDSVVYDIGCSTGKLLKDIANRNNKGSYVGIDIEKDMIEFAKNSLKDPMFKNKKIQFLKDDIVTTSLEKSDLIISYFTVQFIHPKHRQVVINKLYESLNWGGAFLFFEKVRYNDARFQDIFTTLYTDHKLKMGFSPEEIINKTKSLKGVMEPFSSNANIDMMKRAGFKDLTSILKDVCFEGFLAIK